MLNLFLEDIMCDHPIKVKETASVGEVAHLLFRYQINGILVVSDQEEKFIGVFTATDLLRLMADAISQGIHRIEELQKIGDQSVGAYAVRDVITLQKTDKVVKAIAVMHRKNVHTIPIFDGENLVGVIGRHDVLNVALSK